MSDEAKQSVRVVIRRADDFHLHLRDGDVLQNVVPDAAAQFARAIVMPNLKPPVLTTEDAVAYRDRILSARPQGSDFTPLMTLYLTDNTDPQEIHRAKASGAVFAVKLYPAGATTNSASGVTDIRKVYPVLREMEAVGLPLLIHGEVTDPSVDFFDREAEFIGRYLRPLIQEFPGLKIVMEHITTKDAVDFVLSCGPNVGATITAHHLLYNRNSIFTSGLNPHFFCLPILKRETHRAALVAAATSGNPKFFAGTDSAPHPRHLKENDHGCAGCYTAFAALPLYTEVFDGAGALDQLEAFCSQNGANFYGLPLNEGSVVLEKQEWRAPETLPFGQHEVVPIRAGQTLLWKVVSN
eukprot:TRINITY_DN4350_c0_g3_i1.p1 TRINITY_DN4350_c0_g3~~TRINITY_DN4350_c0_g3_i1.p1  ORF type:complete len:353 (-),score=70.42 TRINITY_DN4350_c0_g3_i1:22-1080(-)